jgi:hypothetical protein
MESSKSVVDGPFDELHITTENKVNRATLLHFVLHNSENCHRKLLVYKWSKVVMSDCTTIACKYSLFS